VYKYGSRAMAHEAEKLTAPRVKYLGVFASELARWNYFSSLVVKPNINWIDGQLRRGPRRATADHEGRREEGTYASTSVLTAPIGLVAGAGNAGPADTRQVEVRIANH
jgi:hypothetical protein